MKITDLSILFLSLFAIISCNGQTKNTQSSKLVGGGCEGCELMYIGQPSNIMSVDTSRGWNENGQRLVLSGKVYHLDGKTPAKDVLIYYWQTNAEGIYPTDANLDKTVSEHGYIRGWVRSDAEGRYTIYTIRPAPYPKDNTPAHIHFSIKEPTIGNEYYIDDIMFEGDPYLESYLKKSSIINRGGNGIVKTTQNGNIQYIQRDIILGYNIPDYPKK